MGITLPRTDRNTDSSAVDTATVEELTMMERPSEHAGFISGGLAIASLTLAGIAAIAYLVLAIGFQSEPFVGFMVNRDLEVQNVDSFSRGGWAGLEAGIEPGDYIVADGQNRPFEEMNMEDAQRSFWDYIQTFEQDDRIAFFVEREGSNIQNSTTCVPARSDAFRRCRLSYLITSFPIIDLLGHFGLGYAVGIVAIGVGVVLMVRRPDLWSSQLLSLSAAGIAVMTMGRFDLVTTNQPALTLLWIFAGSLVGSTLVSFGMVFPNNLPVVERIPVARYFPHLIGLVVALIAYAAYTSEQSFALALPLVATFVGLAVLTALMFWRRQYSASPILREQASYVLIGAAFALAVMVFWLFFAIVLGGSIPILLTPILQIAALLFLLSAAYALLQYRLLETDRLVPIFSVYGLLSVMLVISYYGVVVSLSIVGADSIRADDPALVAGIVLVVTLGFVPIRNYLRSQIDEIVFRRRRQYRERLEELTQTLTNALNLNDVERAIRSKLDETLAPTVVILFFRDSRAQVFRSHRNPDFRAPLTDVTFPYTSGTVRFLQNEQSMLYLESGKLPPPVVYPDRGRLAVLNTPIMVRLKGQRYLNGFLAIGSRRSGDAYSYEDLRFIENIADQAALALERSQIVEDLERRLTIQDVLSQVSRALNFAIDLDTLMELIFNQTKRVINTDMFSIAIADPSLNEMHYAFYAEGDERLDIIEGKRWRMGRDLISEIALSQRSVRTENYVAEVRRYDPNSDVENPNIKAWMAVPMTADTVRGSLGVLSVGTVDPLVIYSEEQLQILADIANIAASAIDKTRLFAATQARTKQLEVLNEISNKLSYEIEDVDRLLQLVTQSATEILKSEAGSLLLVDEQSGDLIFRVAVGPSGQELIGMRIPKDANSLAATAVKNAAHIIVNDVTQDNRWHGEVVRDDEDDSLTSKVFTTKNILTTPLFTQGEAIGVLQVINKKDGSSFSEDDATLLTTFAAQAAVAIQNARLFGQTDQQLSLRVEELNRMAEIDRTLNQTIELHAVAEVTLRWAISQTEATAGILAMVESEGNEIRVIASQGYPASSMFHEAINEKFAAKMGLWARVIRSGTPVFMRNLHQDPGYVETLPGAAVQIVVPIISAEEVIGIIIVESENEGSLTLIDMQFLSRLADSSGSAVKNAQLFDQLQLQQTERVRFVSHIAHEFKNPMTSMKGYTDLLIKGIVGPINDQQASFLSTIYNNIDRLQTLVSDLNDLTQLEQNKFKMEMGSVDFSQVLIESLRSVQQGFDRKEQEVVTEIPEDSPLLWGDQRRLVQIMVNFLSNANKYTPPGGKVMLRAESAVNIWDTEGARRVLHIQIQDTGIGISEEDLPKLFREQYFRTDNAKATDEPGTGLGMVLTKGLILQHGGQVWVESKLNEGSTFHFTIPLAEEVIREA